MLRHGHFVNDLNGEGILGTFHKSDFQKQIKKSLELKNNQEKRW